MINPKVSTVSSRKILSATARVKVRFNEVDSLRIVWHGHYLKYFEEGRDAFGEKYELNYLDIYEKEGLVLPVVRTECRYKSSLRYGDVALVETEYVNCESAKLKFQYRIFRESDRQLVTLGETEQIFLNKDGELQLTIPAFHAEWKKKWNLL